jgi:hypothetical protein
MRELPEKKRDATIDAVRKLLKDNNTCPFDFANKEQARVIAGEEEAAYAWVAVNFVDGALLVRDAAWKGASIGHLRHLHESSPSSDDVGGLFFDFEPFRTPSSRRVGERVPVVARRRRSRAGGDRLALRHRHTVSRQR